MCRFSNEVELDLLQSVNIILAKYLPGKQNSNFIRVYMFMNFEKKCLFHFLLSNLFSLYHSSSIHAKFYYSSVVKKNVAILFNMK